MWASHSQTLTPPTLSQQHFMPTSGKRDSGIRTDTETREEKSWGGLECSTIYRCFKNKTKKNKTRVHHQVFSKRGKLFFFNLRTTAGVTSKSTGEPERYYWGSGWIWRIKASMKIANNCITVGQAFFSAVCTQLPCVTATTICILEWRNWGVGKSHEFILPSSNSTNKIHSNRIFKGTNTQN